jgi:hypothetical protein
MPSTSSNASERLNASPAFAGNCAHRNRLAPSLLYWTFEPQLSTIAYRFTRSGMSDSVMQCGQLGA